MERFQRAKLERQVGDIRRELWAWVHTYKEMQLEGNRWNYDQKQLDLADDRANYLEYVAVQCERLEDMLMKRSVP
jgi:hypothetical protein